MKLIVCWGTFPTPRPGGHPCRNAYVALKEAGHDPKVQRGYGLAILPDKPFNLTPGRKEAKRRTGKPTLPILILDDDTTIAGSHNIAAWANDNPA